MLRDWERNRAIEDVRAAYERLSLVREDHFLLKELTYAGEGGIVFANRPGFDKTYGADDVESFRKYAAALNTAAEVAEDAELLKGGMRPNITEIVDE